jgi:hypothetical protein
MTGIDQGANIIHLATPSCFTKKVRRRRSVGPRWALTGKKMRPSLQMVANVDAEGLGEALAFESGIT